MRFLLRSVSFILIFVMITACSSSQLPLPDDARNTAPDSEKTDSAYPAPVSQESDPSYPAPQSDPVTDNGSYPAPQQPTIEVKAFEEEIVPFVITKPLKAGMTEVKGTGPKGVPIILSDMTFSGEEMANTVIQPDGTFVFEVPPLEAQHWLGIKLGSLDSTEWNASTFNDQRFMGPEARLVPQDSFYYDTALVEN